MKQAMVVTMGYGYGEDKYTFEKESDALDFFKLVGKAIKLNRDYISGTGEVFSVGTETKSPSVSYGNIYGRKEIETLLDKEEADRLLEKAEENALNVAESACVHTDRD